jgi:hypothetical protein
MEARDPAGVVALLAPDVVLHSPIITSTFEGRAAVGDLMAGVIAVLDDLSYTGEAGAGDLQVLAFRARVRGRDIEAVDLLRVDGDGLVADITVQIRPMVGLAAVAAALGPRVARGRFGAIVLRVLSAPLPALLGLVEPVVRRFARLRSS